MAHLPWRVWLAVVAASVLLAGCAGTPERGGQGRYGLDLDSATSACRQNPALCARIAGEETVVPLAKPVQVAATIGTTGNAVRRVLKSEESNLIEKALMECAEDARSEVLLKRFKGRSPTPRECRDEAEKDARGNSVTWAMKLGIEMHKTALECARARLGELRPGGFSVEPCCRYNPSTQEWEPISRNEEHALVKEGRSSELAGSLVPDIVIHTGDLRQALAIYDFKFPCLFDKPPEWRAYRKEPHKGQTQKQVYESAFKTSAWRVVPRWGILP